MCMILALMIYLLYYLMKNKVFMLETAVNQAVMATVIMKTIPLVKNLFWQIKKERQFI